MIELKNIYDSKKKIANFTIKLQKQALVPLWSLANQNIIYFSALNKQPILGLRQKKLKKIIWLASKLFATDLLICLIGFLSALRLWRSAKGKQKDGKNYKKIFVGFGARAEEHMFKTRMLNINFPVLRINTSDLSNIGLLGCPTFFEIACNIINAAFGHTHKIRMAINEISSNSINFLLVTAMNIGQYAFFKAYWKIAQHHGVEEIIFIVPNISSFASAHLKIKTSFFQHGLLDSTIIMPQFDYMELLTQEEESYYKYLFPTMEILSKKYSHGVFFSKNKVILISSANANERACQIVSFVKWAISEGFQIVIRPTHNVTLTELRLLNNLLPVFFLDDIKLTFEESMKKWNPLAVIDWTSTVLATALLHHNCLPISFYDPDKGEPLWEKSHHKIFDCLIYPMLKRCLFWLKEPDIIKQTLKSSIKYDKQLKKLTADPNVFV